MSALSKKSVEALLVKAAGADKSEDAMRFSQAALNATNALLGLADIDEWMSDLSDMVSVLNETPN